jgi:hypothetical protein
VKRSSKNDSLARTTDIDRDTDGTLHGVAGRDADSSGRRKHLQAPPSSKETVTPVVIDSVSGSVQLPLGTLPKTGKRAPGRSMLDERFVTTKLSSPSCWRLFGSNVKCRCSVFNDFDLSPIFFNGDDFHIGLFGYGDATVRIHSAKSGERSPHCDLRPGCRFSIRLEATWILRLAFVRNG